MKFIAFSVIALSVLLTTVTSYAEGLVSQVESLRQQIKAMATDPAVFPKPPVASDGLIKRKEYLARVLSAELSPSDGLVTNISELVTIAEEIVSSGEVSMDRGAPNEAGLIETVLWLEEVASKYRRSILEALDNKSFATQGLVGRIARLEKALLLLSSTFDAEELDRGLLARAAAIQKFLEERELENVTTKE